jgi:anaerobic ribonucleoside-triphosphate reductase activating protein
VPDDSRTALQVDERLHAAQIVDATSAEGPGVRTAIWLQGCPLRCAGCCNPEMLPFDGGEVRDVEDVLARALAARSNSGAEGLTLLGGEPFAHAAAAALARRAQQEGLSVMTFTGYEIEFLRDGSIPWAGELLAATDILVDGPYRRDLPDTSRRWIGSKNQRIHFLTERYRAGDPAWERPDTLEIRWDGQALLVNGFPASSAKGFWRRGALTTTRSKSAAVENERPSPRDAEGTSR